MPGPADNTSRERASKETNERGTARGSPGENVLQTKKKTPLVPLELHTSDQIPGGEAPFEERLMGFSTVYAVKSVKPPCVSTLFPLYSHANQPERRGNC